VKAVGGLFIKRSVSILVSKIDAFNIKLSAIKMKLPGIKKHQPYGSFSCCLGG